MAVDLSGFKDYEREFLTITQSVPTRLSTVNTYESNAGTARMCGHRRDGLWGFFALSVPPGVVWDGFLAASKSPSTQAPC
jgi:hypothetical protein